jgi:hypothetical protein
LKKYDSSGSTVRDEAPSKVSQVEKDVPVVPVETPLVVPPDLLCAAETDMAMDPVEELRLIKAEISDVVRVCNAVANGDLSHRVYVAVNGPFMTQVKDVVNSMVDRLDIFANEVIRISFEDGTTGCLAGAAVTAVLRGQWRNIIDLVRIALSFFGLSYTHRSFGRSMAYCTIT